MAKAATAWHWFTVRVESGTTLCDMEQMTCSFAFTLKLGQGAILDVLWKFTAWDHVINWDIVSSENYYDISILHWE